MASLLINTSTLTQTLEQALQTTYSHLTAFASAEDFTAKMTQSFGNSFNAGVAQKLAQDWAKGDFTALPSIAIRSAVEINGAMGAFAKATNTIYLSREYLAQNAGNPEAVASVLLEEAGHYVDAYINDIETPGDEGAIFSALVRGQSLSEQELQQLRAEDDSATILLDGQILVIEQATFTGTNGDDTLPASGTGNGGNDTFDPRLGNDSVNGGTGTDVLIVNYATAGSAGNGMYSYVPGDGSGYVYAYNGSSYDQINFTSIEQFNVTGTNFDDTLYGGTLNDTLNGGGGNDSINGGTGNDTINGGDGNDTLSGGGGIDKIDGGAGVDVLTDADFSTATTNLTFGDTGTTHAAIALANGSSVSGIELFDGLKTGSGNDNISFSQRRDNVINTGAGNDTINSGLGYDSVDGGAGTDVLIVNYATAGSAGNGMYSYVPGDGSGYVYAYNGSSYDQINFTSIEQFNVTGTNFDDTLYGGTLNDTLNGGGGNDSINGGAGNDILDGGLGADQLIGGLGNDIYVVNVAGNSGDIITEYADEGIDTVQSSVNWTLGATSNLENLTLTGTAAINGTGNSLNNTITGNSGANTLNGEAGIDTLIGGNGNDIYIVDTTTDTITETATGGIDTVESSVSYTLAENSNLENLTLTGTAAINGTGNSLNNVITGNSGANTLTGLAGNDILNGGAGIDTLIGGDGNDTYLVDTSTDTISETATGGTDTVQSSVNYILGDTSYLENLTLTGTEAINGTGNSLNNVITGNSGANTLTGLAGNDILNGGVGIDTLIGGDGNDTYIVDTTTDTITEMATGGIDAVESYVSYTLAENSNLENLTLTGTSAIDGTGNSLNNVITGNSGANTLTGLAGNDILNGGAGIDTLIGGDGNDTYIVDTTTDTITETATGGTDTVESYVSYTLAENSNLENLTLTGTVAINGTGNSLNNTMTGNAANNTFDGGAGNDTLIGGLGNDMLVGGLGNDTLTGGAGLDSFTFNAPNQGVDTVTDFVVVDDAIVVSATGFGGNLIAGAAITAEQFVLGTAATDASDRFIYNSTNGALFFDVDGTGSIAGVQIATLGTKPLITNADIVVIA